MHFLEIASFVAFVVCFECAERLAPARSVDRRAELITDVLSFAAALLLNRLAMSLIHGSLDLLDPGLMPGWLESLHSLPSVPKILVGIVLVDFTIYWLHRAQHAYSFLWRTHAWHHSIREMYWFSGFRTSLLHSLFNNIPQVVIPSIILGANATEIGIGYAIALFVQFWEHSNVTVRCGPLRRILVTPDFHRAHHAEVGHGAWNFGNVFPLWDRVFGTHLDPDRLPAAVTLGLGRMVKGREFPRLLIGV